MILRLVMKTLVFLTCIFCLSACVQTNKYMTQKYYSKAAGQIEQELSEPGLGKDDELKLCLDLSKTYRMLGQYEQAFRYSKKAVALDSDNIEALEQLAYTHNDVGEYDSAIKYGQEIVSILDRQKTKLPNIYKSYNEAYYDLDYFYRKSKKYGDAERYYSERLQLNPEGIPEKRFYVSGLLLNNKLVEAEKFLAKEENTKLYYYASLEMSWINDYDLAVSFMEKSAAHKSAGNKSFPRLELINSKLENFKSRQYLVNQRWPEYLKAIEKSDNYDNWSKPPYTELVSRRPYNK